MQTVPIFELEPSIADSFVPSLVKRAEIDPKVSRPPRLTMIYT